MELTKALEIFKDVLSKPRRGGLMDLHLASYMEYLAQVSSTGCAGGLTRTPKGVDLILSRVEESYLKPETKTFVDWLTLESPYAPVYVTKGYEQVLECQAFITDANFPVVQVIESIIAQRALWEGGFDTIPYQVDRLSKLGVHPALAYLAAHEYKCGEEVATPYPRYGHCVCDPTYLNVTNALKFAGVMPVEFKVETTFKEKRGYSGVGLRENWKVVGDNAFIEGSFVKLVRGVEVKEAVADDNALFKAGWKAYYMPHLRKDDAKTQPIGPFERALAAEIVKFQKEHGVVYERN